MDTVAAREDGPCIQLSMLVWGRIPYSSSALLNFVIRLHFEAFTRVQIAIVLRNGVSEGIRSHLSRVRSPHRSASSLNLSSKRAGPEALCADGIQSTR